MSSPREPAVMITIKEVYDAVTGLGTKVDGCLIVVTGIKTVTDDHEGRMRKLENWVKALAAAVIMVGGGEQLIKALGGGT